MGMRETIREVTRSDSTVLASFREYRPVGVHKPKERNGVIVSFDDGQSTKYDMEHACEKGILFIKERDRVYQGMICGEHILQTDIDVCMAKGENRGDVRRKHKEVKKALPTPRDMPLEACLAYISEEEEIEVTPLRIAMRKTVLNPQDRARLARKKKHI